MKKILAIAAAAILLLPAGAQQLSTVPVEKGERWWGAASTLGPQMPLYNPTGMISLSTDNQRAQAVPFLVSNYGRYIWGEKPFDFSFNGKEIIISGPEQLKAEKAAKTLREAYILAHNKHFKGSGKTPPRELFERPVYNTCIDMMLAPTQAAVERYAADALANGFPAGTIIIDQYWQKYNGSFEFQADKFPDPKAMIDRLHSQGFKVMLGISPFVSPDSPESRILAREGVLIKEKGHNRMAIIRWRGGISACYDLTNPATIEYLTLILNDLRQEYGIDGFKFDVGDFSLYDPAVQDYFADGTLPAEHVFKWAELGIMFPLNEYCSCWGMQGEALVQRMADKEHTWEELPLLIPEMLNAGLMGHAYTCADRIGGSPDLAHGDGEMPQFDPKLIVRTAQMHAMMPMMQFSVGPWRILDQEHLAYCMQAVKIRERFEPYIFELAEAAARTGEPIIRHMEYMFPAKGFSDCNDQFMLGSKYLVAPILNAEGKRSVRLPNGTWIDDKGTRIKGPVVLNISAETGRLPYFEYKGVIKEPKPVTKRRR